MLRSARRSLWFTLFGVTALHAASPLAVTVVQGHSMEPTLPTDQFLIINKATYQRVDGTPLEGLFARRDRSTANPVFAFSPPAKKTKAADRRFNPTHRQLSTPLARFSPATRSAAQADRIERGVDGHGVRVHYRPGR